jgi:hypothetical protein
MKTRSTFGLGAVSILCACNLGRTVIGEYEGTGSGSGSGDDADAGTTDLPTDTTELPTDTTLDETGTTANDCPAEVLPLCELCPDALDGLGCAGIGAMCSNGVDRSCICDDDGTWTCSAALLGDACGPECAMQDQCDDEVCKDGLRLAVEIGPFSGDFGEVADGEYDIAIVADGEPIDCHFEIFFEPFSEAYVWADWGCEGGGVEPPGGYPQADGDAAVIVMPPAAELEVTATLDGVELLSTTFVPQYQIELPNAAGCEPACVFADVVVTPKD